MKGYDRYLDDNYLDALEDARAEVDFDRARTLRACASCVESITSEDLTTLDLLDTDAASESKTRVREGLKWWRANGWTLRVVTGRAASQGVRCDICHAEGLTSAYDVEAIPTTKGDTK